MKDVVGQTQTDPGALIAPAEAEANLARVGRMYSQFASAVEGSSASEAFRSRWASQLAEWDRFEDAMMGPLGKINQARALLNPLAGAVANQQGASITQDVFVATNEFEGELADWQDAFAEETGRPPAGPLAERPKEREGVNWNRVILFGGIIAATAVAAYAISSLSEASGEARWWHGRLS